MPYVFDDMFHQRPSDSLIPQIGNLLDARFPAGRGVAPSPIHPQARGGLRLARKHIQHMLAKNHTHFGL